jgi:colanic acid biosynthesis protein WcaH
MTIDVRNIPQELYNTIKQVIPIVCVDLVVIDDHNRILLVKRNNEPAKNQWWFPGGRVHHGEFRIEAAKRKLIEECRLSSENIKEIGTYECMLPHPNQRFSHAVTTVYQAYIRQNEIILDNQSDDYCWKQKHQWEEDLLHEFILRTIKNVKE